MMDNTITIEGDNTAPIVVGNNNHLTTIIHQALGSDVSQAIIDALTLQIVTHFTTLEVKLDTLAQNQGLSNYLLTQIQEASRENKMLQDQLRESQQDREKDRATILKMEQETQSADYKLVLQEAQKALESYDSQTYQSILKHYQEDQRFAQELKNHANSHYLRGMDYKRNSNYKDARIQLETAVRYAPENGEYLLSYGSTLLYLSEYDEALRLFTKALSIFQAIGDSENEGVTLNNIGQIYKSWGDLSTALTYLEKSLSLCQSIGDKSGEGTMLNNMGQIYAVQNDHTKALKYLEQSLSIAKAIGDKEGEGVTLNNLSQIYHTQGDLTTALTYLQRALAISQAIGDKSGEGATLNNMGQIYQSKSDRITALNYYEKSLTICQIIGNPLGEGATLFNIGHIHWENEDHERAVRNWVEAYRIAKKTQRAQALSNLEELAKGLGHEEGLELWEKLSQMRP